MPSPEQLAMVEHVRAVDRARAMNELANIFRLGGPDVEQRARSSIHAARAMVDGRYHLNRMAIGADRLPNDEALAYLSYIGLGPGMSWLGRPFSPPKIAQYNESDPRTHRLAIQQANTMNMNAAYAKWLDDYKREVARVLSGLPIEPAYR